MAEDPTAGDLERRSRRMEREGDWAELRDLLVAAGRDTVLSRRALSYRLGRALYHTGRMRDLSEFAQHFEKASRARADGLGVMQALNLGGTAAFELGETESARDRYEELRALAEGEEDEEMLGRSAHNLGMVLVLAGRDDEALVSFRLARTLYEKLGLRRPLAQLEHNLGIAHRDGKRFRDASEAYRRASALAEELDYPFLRAMATVGRAEAELLAGDPSFAQQLVIRGLATAERVGDPVTTGEAFRVRAGVRAAGAGDGHLSDALDDTARALELARQTGNRLLEAESERDRALLLDRLGRKEEARTTLERALAAFREIGAAAYAEEARTRLEGLG